MAGKSRIGMLLNGELAELFVKDVQPYLPTWFLRFLVATWMKYCGYLMRSGDVVVQQITLDRKERVTRPVTTEVEVTNEQLYANDPEFFLLHLGPKLKYSACEWPEGCDTLGKAEEYTIANPTQQNTVSRVGNRIAILPNNVCLRCFRLPWLMQAARRPCM